MTPLRFGIIGAGNIARTHAAALHASTAAELVAVAGGRAAESFALAEGATHHADPIALVDSPAVDAVILCTPSGARRDLAIAAAERGKHVLVEKPIEVSRERARAMIEACERHDVTLGVVFQSRFKPACSAVAETVHRGELGALVLGDASVKWYRPPEYYRSAAWRGTWALDGGGALMNQAIHSVDLLLWFLGDVRSVSATTRNRYHTGIEVEDTVVARLEFANGGLGSISASTAAYPGSARRIEIHGTEGTVTLFDDRIHDWQRKDGAAAPAGGEPSRASGSEASHVVSDHHWHQLQIEDFVDAVRSGRAPLVDGREGMRSLELVLAVYASARQGRAVELPANG